MHVIGICGKIGSGKDFVADYICLNYGYTRITVSDIILEQMAKEGKLNPSREDKTNFNKEKIAKYGINYWMDLIIKKIKNEKLNKVVVAGLRYPSDISSLKEAFGKNFISFLVDVDPQVRYKRMISRARADMPQSYEDFIEQEKKEDETFNLSQTFAMIDYKIDNNGTPERTSKIVDELMQKLKLGKKKMRK